MILLANSESPNQTVHMPIAYKIHLLSITLWCKSLVWVVMACHAGSLGCNFFTCCILRLQRLEYIFDQGDFIENWNGGSRLNLKRRRRFVQVYYTLVLSYSIWVLPQWWDRGLAYPADDLGLTPTRSNGDKHFLSSITIVHDFKFCFQLILSGLSVLGTVSILSHLCINVDVGGERRVHKSSLVIALFWKF